VSINKSVEMGRNMKARTWATVSRIYLGSRYLQVVREGGFGFIRNLEEDGMPMRHDGRKILWKKRHSSRGEGTAADERSVRREISQPTNEGY